MDKLQIETNGSGEEREIMLTWLREFNHAENGPFFRSLSEGDGAEKELFLVARENGKSIGGLLAVTLHKWLKIQLMAVAPDHRRRGVGRELVSSAEVIAAKRGCEFAYADTMSYQAPEFYRELGYNEAGRLINWDSHGHDKTFWSKRLGVNSIEKR